MPEDTAVTGRDLEVVQALLRQHLDNDPTLPVSPDLPINAFASEIKETALHHDSFLVVGETGSGKSTRLPLILREVIGPEDKVAITQPRRVAARSVARYVADQVGCPIGDEVGFTVRFEDRTTEGTRINFMTDGILLRKIQDDPLLSEYSVVMVDEVHERSLNIDFTLGLLKRLQVEREQAGLPPLKIVVTSATLEKEKLAAYFDGSPVVEIPGRMHPVDVHYEEHPVHDYVAAAAEKVQLITQNGKEGDILIFMPGADEINKTIEHIRRLGITDADILPLHGQLAPEDQDKIFAIGTRRKIIVATNVAETSVTVTGVRHVIDSGLIKQIEFDASTGIEALLTRPHAQSGCIQRAGRAGRVAPGDCYRLYTESDFKARREFQLPEIRRSNLAHVVLTMKKIGIDDIESFEFIDPPDRETLHQALETLKTLGALDMEGNMTEIGHVMSELPLEPHIARMVIEAEKHGCVEQVCTIAAFLGGRSVFSRPRDKEVWADAAHRQFRVESSDFLTLLNVWKQYESNRFNDQWARENYLNAKTLGEVREIRYQLFRALKRNGIRAFENEDPDAIGKSIAAGLVENLMEYYGRYSYRRVKDGTSGFFIHPSSTTFGGDPRFMVPAEIVRTSKTYARVCQNVKPDWIREIAPQLVQEQPRPASYDPITDKVVRSIELSLKGSSSAFTTEQRELVGDEATKVFAEALAAGRLELPFVTENQRTLAALTDLYVRSGGQSHEPLFVHNVAAIYEKRLQSISSRRDLEAALASGELNLSIELDEYVSPEERAKIMMDNPDTVQVGDTIFDVSYIQRGYDENRFSARLRIPASHVVSLQDLPTIPSGRAITIEVVDKKGSPYKQFEGTDLEDLRRRSRDLLNNQQWDIWRFAQPEGFIERRLDGFDVLADSHPTLPDVAQYGIDPQTGEALYAYPAISVSRSVWSNHQFYIRFYPSQIEAYKAQEQAEIVKKEILQKQQIEKDKVELLPTVRILHEEVRAQFTTVGYDNYEAFGLSYSEWRQLQEQLSTATYQIERDPRAVQAQLQGIQDRLLQAQAEKAEKDRLAREREVEAAAQSASHPAHILWRELSGELYAVKDRNYRDSDISEREWYQLQTDLSDAVSQIERNPDNAERLLQRVKDRLQSQRVEETSGGGSMADAFARAGLTPQQPNVSHKAGVDSGGTRKEHVVGLNKYEQNRKAWELLHYVDIEEAIQLATANSTKDVRMSELATVRALVSMPWSKLRLQIGRLNIAFPYLDGATKRIHTLARDVPKGNPADTVGQEIIDEASQFSVLKPALTIAQSLMFEWVGESPDLQDNAFRLFLQKLSNASTENDDVASSLADYKPGQAIPSALEDLFVQSAQEL